MIMIGRPGNYVHDNVSYIICKCYYLLAISHVSIYTINSMINTILIVYRNKRAGLT